MSSTEPLLYILLAFAALLELATSAPSECPGGWTYVGTGDTCYKFLKGVKDGLRGRLTGDEAEQACSTLGGHLTTIPSGEIGVAIEKALNITDGYHIGLRYDFATQAWRWTDGKEALYTNWEPYDSRSGSANTVDAKKNGACVEVGYVDVKHQTHGHWRNIPCDGRSGHWNEAVCQRPTCAKMSCSRIERTFVFVKPDGVQRGLVGKIIQRFEERGYKLVGLKQVQASRKQLEDHYRRLNAQPSYAELIVHMSSAPVVAMVWEGLEAVRQTQAVLGASDPLAAAPGTIRGDYAIQSGRNVCDASESLEEAQSAIAYWFKPEEVFDYKLAHEKWIYVPEQLHGPNRSRDDADALEA